jgi:hypothetical protein
MYSTTTAIKLHFYFDQFDLDELIEYPSSETPDLGRIFNRSYPIRHLTTSYNDEVIGITTSDIVGAQTRSSVPQVQVDIHPGMEIPLSSRKTAITKLLQSLFKSIPTQDLESLQVIQDFSVEIWPIVFDCLTGVQLKRLDVTGDGSGIGFLQAFSPIPRSQRDAANMESGLPPVLSLRELSIERWDFTESVDGISCFAWLKTCLEHRKMNHRAALHSLSLTECRRITPEDVKELQAVVTGDVTWQRSSWEDLPLSLLSDDNSEDEDESDEE